jgi:hypothetical protein
MEQRMLRESQWIAHTREHLSWAYRFSLFWFLLSLGVFGAAYAVCEIGEVPSETRELTFIMLGTIIVTNAIWQAAALALARLEKVILPRAGS